MAKIVTQNRQYSLIFADSTIVKMGYLFRVFTVIGCSNWQLSFAKLFSRRSITSCHISRGGWSNYRHLPKISALFEISFPCKI